MQLRSSKIIGMPKHSYTMTNIPVQSHGIGQRIMLIVFTLSIGSIVVFTYILYTLMFFITPLQTETVDHSKTINWSKIFIESL